MMKRRMVAGQSWKPADCPCIAAYFSPRPVATAAASQSCWALSERWLRGDSSLKGRCSIPPCQADRKDDNNTIKLASKRYEEMR
jgi:hypothetical protein